MRSLCSRAVFSKRLRCAVRSASAVVRSLKIFSAAVSSASASDTLASTPLRRPALSRASARMVSSSAARRAIACSASAREPLLALGVGGELHKPQIEFGDAVLGARLFAVEILQGDIEPVQRRAGTRLGLAQFRQGWPRRAPDAWTPRLRARRARRPCARRGPWRARLPSPRCSRPSSANDRASLRPCAPATTRCDSGSPGAPASSSRRSGRRAGR